MVIGKYICEIIEGIVRVGLNFVKRELDIKSF
jgi:hypothetical protein